MYFVFLDIKGDRALLTHAVPWQSFRGFSMGPAVPAKLSAAKSRQSVCNSCCGLMFPV